MMRCLTQKSLNQNGQAQVARSGATLIEVLMSLMIMGVGITSVIALFPLSMLSSIRATQMTNSKLLEQNVVDLIRTYPQMVEGFPQWQPNTNYFAPNSGGGVTPIESSRVAAVPEVGRPLSSTNYFFTAANGTSGYLEPNWYATSINDNGIAWTASKPSGMVYQPDTALSTSLQRTAYVVDPLGYWNSTDSDASAWNIFATPGVRTRFGSNYAGTGAYVSGTLTALPRLAADLPQNVAEKLFSLPDSWQLIAETIPTMAPTQDGTTGRWTVSLPSPNDFTALTGSADGSARITFISTDKSQTITRDLYIGTATAPSPNTTCQLKGSLPNDPLSSMNIGSVRVESFTRRYSFLLTVIRNPDGTAKIQCPVFFNRSFSGIDERAFDVMAISQDTFRITDTNFGSAIPRPQISEGHFVYDALLGQWYKIVSVSTSSPVEVTVDRSIIVADPTASTFNTGLMFPTGVINVFDIEL